MNKQYQYVGWDGKLFDDFGDFIEYEAQHEIDMGWRDKEGNWMKEDESTKL